MKTIIAGSRSIGRLSARRWNYELLVNHVEAAVAASGFEVTEVITGGAGGPDRAGEQWAATLNLPVTTINPNWRLGRGAGLIANRQLAEAGEALIALHDGESKGTQDMIDQIRAAGLPVYVHYIQADD